jgi:hypothetical protein
LVLVLQYSNICWPVCTSMILEGLLVSIFNKNVSGMIFLVCQHL